MNAYLMQLFFYLMPAYIANGTPLVLKGKHPIDCGKKWRGARILGDGKTIEGAIGGIFMGTVTGFVLAPYAKTYFPNYLILSILMSTGAILGDMVKSFFKRRMGIPRGESWPLFDQLDFITGAMILGSILYVPSTLDIALVILLTLIFHISSNRIAYILKIKKVPW